MAKIPPTPAWALADVTAYLTRKASQRGASQHTIDAYRRDLAQFFAFCERAGVVTLDEIDRRMVRRYLAYLDTIGYARRSVARKASAVRAFFADLTRRGELPLNPAEQVARLKLPR
ncbi:MAG: site-specific integrase, partial [Acidimicrobiia bacterium]|nr:site-specific integrase [Acidimicrobiia bacterium]